MPEQSATSGTLSWYFPVSGLGAVVNFDLFLPHDCGEVTHIGAATSLTPAFATEISAGNYKGRTAGNLLFRRPDIGDFFLCLPVDLPHQFSDEPYTGIKDLGLPNTGLNNFPTLGTQLAPIPTRVKAPVKFISGVYFDRINQALGLTDHYPLLINLNYKKK